MRAEFAERQTIQRPEEVRAPLTVLSGGEDAKSLSGEGTSALSSHSLIQEAVMLRKEITSNLRTGEARGISFADSLQRATSKLTNEELAAATLPVRDELPDKTVSSIEKRVRAQVPTGRITDEGELGRRSVPRDSEEVEAEVSRKVALRLIEFQARSAVPQEFEVNTPHHTEMERPFLHDVDGTEQVIYHGLRTVIEDK